MTNQEVAKCILISLGCRVDLAENGCQAVEMSENASYDLIFMDCQMPVMDGFAATRAIRTRESGENKGSSCICSNLPIISLTANALSGDRDLCLAAGMDDYLSKPFNFEQMRAILKQWLPDKCVRAALPDEVGLAANSPNTAAPEAIPPDDASAIFNRNELKVRLGGNEAVIERFVAMFIGNTTNSLVSLKDAVEKGDCEKIRLHTHALKGAAGNIAAGTMRKLATAIETDAETGGLTNVTQLFMSLEKAFTAFKSVVGDSEPSLSEINPK
jgi:CheY-like chemotaxis protein/HPt (histidine-containing phosphotransfer) domain-containing protein